MMVAMARQQITRYTDDLDGTPLDEGQGKHITFSIEGRSYEIDLTAENADKLYAALAPFVDVARSVSARGAASPRRPRKSKGEFDLGAVREWARANGHSVSERGRVSAAILDAYRDANG